MNEGATVLVVEDDGPLRSFLRTALGAHGYRVLEAQTLGEATIVVTTHNPEVVLLDLGLPDGDGLEVLRELRRVSDVPVIIATARGEETDRIVGLELGADDYVVKPFSVRELAARVRAVARRRRIDTSLDSGRLVVDRARHRVVLDGTPVELTAKEFDLLAVLAEEPGRAVPRQELFSRVWDPVWIGTGKTLDVHIASLRKKLGDAELIETVRGVGYRLSVDSA